MKYKFIIVIAFLFLGAPEMYSQTFYRGLPNTIDFSDLDTFKMSTHSRKEARIHKSIVYSGQDSTLLVKPIIGNQGRQGSCISWALSYATSIIEFDYYGNWKEAQKSPAFIHNKYIHENYNSDEWNCNNGIPFSQISSILNKDGICSFVNMPYIIDSCDIMPSDFAQFEASLHKYQIKQLSTNSNIDTFKSIIREDHPIIVAHKLTSEFYSMWYSNGIWSQNNPHPDSLNHAGCIYGYNDSTRMFKVLNSWGQSGGENGHYWVSYDLVEAGCYYAAAVVEPLDSNAVKYAIYGPDTICENAEYRLTSVPLASVVTWSTVGVMTPSLLVTGNHEYCTVSRNEQNVIMSPSSNQDLGEDIYRRYIRATITTSDTSFVVQKEIFPGSITSPTIFPPLGFPLYARGNKKFWTTNAHSGDSIKWTYHIGSGATQTYFGDTLQIGPSSSGILTITVQNFNNCEGYQTATAIYQIKSRLFGLNIDNISENSISVSIDADEKEEVAGCSIQILTESMHEVYNEPCSATHIAIPRHNIKRGIYILRLIQDGQIADTKPLIIL